MTRFSNDNDFRESLNALPADQVRKVTAQFVERLLHLNDDKRVADAIHLAKQPEIGAAEQLRVFNAARSATVESRTRCGADCNWDDQAAHFIARASAAVIAPEGKCQAADPVWQVVMSCRMAQNCALIAADDESVNQENEHQYRILEEFLNA
jgi:hypothetical protein